MKIPPSYPTCTPGDETNLALSPEDRKARQAIWADIDRLHLRIVDKKREVNCGRPIFCLNHDVMLEIFIHCALASMFPPFGYRPRGQKAYEWLNVTRVCHYWREIALNSPRLWSHFLLTNSAPRTRELLARSKRATLSVESDRETSISDGQVLELLFENINRTRVLDIALDHRRPIPSIQLPLVAPQLTRFILRCDYRMQEPFPVLFNGCDMPKLLHLELHNVAITWPNSVLRASLTHLVITAPCLAIRQAPGLPPLPSLIDVLKDMPLLEHLDLKSFSRILRIPPSETRLLRLDHLRLLKLAEGGTLCASFLSHIIHPATACIHLSPDFSRNTSQDVKALRKAILEKLDGTKTVEGVQQFVTTAAFKSMSMGNTTEIAVWTSETSLEDLAEEGECFRASQNAFLRVRYNHFIPIPLRTVYKILPLDNVTKLFFDEETAGIHDWIAISQSLPNVEHIVAQKSLKWTPQFLSAQTSDDIERHAPAFPKLKTLMLSKIWFRTWGTVRGDAKEVKAWSRMLATRKEAGYMLEELILHECTNLLACDVEALEGMVGKVVWDAEASEKRRTLPSDMRRFLDDSP